MAEQRIIAGPDGTYKAEYRCKRCLDFPTFNRGEMSRHLMVCPAETNGRLNFHCRICDRTRNLTISGFIRHESYCRGPAQLPCKHCSSFYSNNAQDLIAHERNCCISELHQRQQSTPWTALTAVIPPPTVEPPPPYSYNRVRRAEGFTRGAPSYGPPAFDRNLGFQPFHRDDLGFLPFNPYRNDSYDN